MLKVDGKYYNLKYKEKWKTTFDSKTIGTTVTKRLLSDFIAEYLHVNIKCDERVDYWNNGK